MPGSRCCFISCGTSMLRSMAAMSVCAGVAADADAAAGAVTHNETSEDRASTPALQGRPRRAPPTPARALRLPAGDIRVRTPVPEAPLAQGRRVSRGLVPPARLESSASEARMTPCHPALAPTRGPPTLGAVEARSILLDSGAGPEPSLRSSPRTREGPHASASTPLLRVRHRPFDPGG